MSDASLGSAGESRAVALLPQDWNTWQCCCPGAGARAREGLTVPSCCECQRSNQAVAVAGKSNNCANNQAELSLLHVYFGLCQSVGPGTLLMVKERCIFTVLKVDLMGKSCDVNRSITLVMYLMWCDSAEATALLDWFILAESLTQSEFCLLLSCWLRMNLNKIHLLSF